MPGPGFIGACVLLLSLRGAPASFVLQPEVEPPRTPGVERDPFDPEAARSLNDVLSPIRERHNIPSLAGAIVSGDGLVALGAVGRRSLGAATPVTPADAFHIGSCTKAMTATLIAALAEEGTLSWDLTLEKALPELAPRMDPGFRGVTVEQLLTHRAGAPGDLNSDGLWARLRRHTGTPTEQRATLAQAVLARAPVHTPGGTYLYSNAGYAIAGYIAEERTGQAWEDLMRRRIFEPLGMTSAGFGAPGSADSIDQPRGHSQDGQPIEPGKEADNPASIGPAGTVRCSLPDWGRFIALHLRGEHGDQRLGSVVIRRETFARMHAPVKGEGADYAMGWAVTTRPWAGDPGIALAHSGSNTMWFCSCWLAPAKRFAVLTATNIAGEAAAKALDEAAGAMIRDHLGRTAPNDR